MNKVLNYLTNKAMCAAFVVLGAASASAELVKEPIYDAENVSVGYKVTGLENDEVAMVFTNHERVATWTVPANLKNVQFLVVGGGGGGGAGTQGPGGGGGGVITGKVVSLSYGSKVVAKVGVGGKPGLSNATGGSKGENSYFSVDGTTYVTAYAGGAGRSNKNGGSGGGGSAGYSGGTSSQAYITEEIASLLFDVEKFGYPGGDGFKTSNSNVSGGGGGGALGVGGTPTGKTNGGTGGPGLPCDITGTLLTYGSGGGGSGTNGSSGGSGAGSGGNPASSGKANQGGGGGGGCGYGGDGGNGGSGIVVFRYSLVATVASVGGVEYASLQEAVDAADAGAEITVVDDIVTDGPVTVNKQVTINLNGKTITATDDKSGDGVFYVVANGDLTLKGDGTVNALGPNDYCMAIWADGGKVTINGGTYTNEGAKDDGPDGTHFDLIYAKNGGSVEINGGTFKCQTPNWTLNSHDTAKGTIVVKGGTFYLFNPSDCTTEGAGTNWCADGYVAEFNNEGYYVVAKLAIAPNGTTEVTANSPDDAASKVTILVPDAMKDVVTADKYAEYFVKSAEYNETTGKYTVTAALNPDVVKPVIAETTADDTTKEAFVIDAYGNVTLNINNKKPGLYYGVQVLKELGADPVAVVSETEDGTLVVPAEKIPEGNAAFFRVVVDFEPIGDAE